MAKNEDHKGIERITTTLGRETDFNGVMRFKDSLKIDGNFSGEIVSPGFLYVEQGASITANIHVGSVVIGGTVKGNIEATDKLEMLSTGKVFGNIRTGKLKIADGVVFEGKCEMIKNPQAINVFPGPVDQLKKTAQSVYSKTAVVLSAGTELTEGIIQDTHVRFLASELTSLGFALRRAVQFPDDALVFQEELARATRDACLVIITGGLGPTTDDLSREIIAQAAGEPLEFHPEAWQAIEERFKGRKLSETNRKQALAPRGFALLANPNGTAPGFHGSVGESLVIALPGPPGELRPMFSQSVLPLLAERFGAPGAGEIFWGTALMVPESNLEEGLRACRRPGITWGTRVDEDRISFSLRGGATADRQGMFEELVKQLDPTRIRRGETRPSQLLTEALLNKGATLAAAESCTGGLIGKYMTDLPGSSRVFWGGSIVYADEAKQRLLGVGESLLREHGAVSEAVAAAMAEGVLSRSGADAGVAVTGIAGPDGGTAEKPVGTVWIAVAMHGEICQARLFTFGGSRDMIRRRAAVAAMLFTEAQLAGREFLDSKAKW